MRKVEKESPAPAAPASGPAAYTLSVDGKSHDLSVDGDRVTVNGRTYQVSMSEGGAPAGAAAPAADGGSEVTAQMPGRVLKIIAAPGTRVEAGGTVLVLEAMKMEVQINAPEGGTVLAVEVAVGDQVANGQVLARIG